MVEVWRQTGDGGILVNPYAITVDDIGKQFRFHSKPYTLLGYQVFLEFGELVCRVRLASGGLKGSYSWYSVKDEGDWLYRL